MFITLPIQEALIRLEDSTGWIVYNITYTGSPNKVRRLHRIVALQKLFLLKVKLANLEWCILLLLMVTPGECWTCCYLLVMLCLFVYVGVLWCAFRRSSRGYSPPHAPPHCPALRILLHRYALPPPPGLLSLQIQGGVSLTAMDCPTGVEPFCYGQIAWDDGLSPGRTVRRC